MSHASIVQHLLQISGPRRCLHTVIATDVLLPYEHVWYGALACLFRQESLHGPPIRFIIQLDRLVRDLRSLEQILSLVAVGTVRLGEDHDWIGLNQIQHILAILTKRALAIFSAGASRTFHDDSISFC